MGTQPEERPEEAGKREVLEAYLREALTEGPRYFKSRKVAAETGLSSKEIGALFFQLQNADTDLCIDKWGYSSSTTWRVEKDRS